MSKIFAICTDGTEIACSRFVTDVELSQLNDEAQEATAGNWWWEPGSPENADLPKMPEYRHIPTRRIQDQLPAGKYI